MASDRIEQEISIAAPIERVWAVITEPEHVSHWFSPEAPAEIDLRPGGIMRLDHGQYGVFPMRIVSVDRPRYLAYRWAAAFPGEVADERNSTLVEFTLDEDGPGRTTLTLVESGFTAASVPADRSADAGYDSKAAGWPEALDGMRRYAEQSAA